MPVNSHPFCDAASLPSWWSASAAAERTKPEPRAAKLHGCVRLPGRKGEGASAQGGNNLARDEVTSPICTKLSKCTVEIRRPTPAGARLPRVFPCKSRKDWLYDHTKKWIPYLTYRLAAAPVVP